MNRKLILFAFLFWGTNAFSQTLSQRDIQKNACNYGLKAMKMLRNYLFEYDLFASHRALRYLDTAQLFINEVNEDSLAIPVEDFSHLKDVDSIWHKLNYKKVLTDEKKSQKVKIRVEGRIFLWSRNNFQPVYTLLRVYEYTFKNWNENL